MICHFLWSIIEEKWEMFFFKTKQNISGCYDKIILLSFESKKCKFCIELKKRHPGWEKIENLNLLLLQEDVGLHTQLVISSIKGHSTQISTYELFGNDIYNICACDYVLNLSGKKIKCHHGQFNKDICSMPTCSQRRNVLCLLFQWKPFRWDNDRSKLGVLNSCLRGLVFALVRENMRLCDPLFCPRMAISMFL